MSNEIHGYVDILCNVKRNLLVKIIENSMETDSYWHE